MTQSIFEQHDILDQLFVELKRIYLTGQTPSYEQLRHIAAGLTYDEYELVIERFVGYVRTHEWQQLKNHEAKLKEQAPTWPQDLLADALSFEQEFTRALGRFLQTRELKLAQAMEQRVKELDLITQDLQKQLQESNAQRLKLQDELERSNAALERLKAVSNTQRAFMQQGQPERVQQGQPERAALSLLEQALSGAPGVSPELSALKAQLDPKSLALIQAMMQLVRTQAAAAPDTAAPNPAPASASGAGSAPDQVTAALSAIGTTCADYLVNKEDSDLTSLDVEQIGAELIKNPTVSVAKLNAAQLKRLIIKSLFLGVGALQVSDLNASDEEIVAALKSEQDQFFARAMLSFARLQDKPARPATPKNPASTSPATAIAVNAQQRAEPTHSQMAAALIDRPISAATAIVRTHSADAASSASGAPMVDLTHSELPLEGLAPADALQQLQAQQAARVAPQASPTARALFGEPDELINSVTPKALPREEGTILQDIAPSTSGDDSIVAFAAASAKIESLAPLLHDASRELSHAKAALDAALTPAEQKPQPESKPQASRSLWAPSTSDIWAGTEGGANVGAKELHLTAAPAPEGAATSEIASVAKDVLKVADELDRATDEKLKQEKKQSLFAQSAFTGHQGVNEPVAPQSAADDDSFITGNAVDIEPSTKAQEPTVPSAPASTKSPAIPTAPAPTTPVSPAADAAVKEHPRTESVPVTPRAVKQELSQYTSIIINHEARAPQRSAEPIALKSLSANTALVRSQAPQPQPKTVAPRPAAPSGSSEHTTIVRTPTPAAPAAAVAAPAPAAAAAAGALSLAEQACLQELTLLVDLQLKQRMANLTKILGTQAGAPPLDLKALTHFYENCLESIQRQYKLSPRLMKVLTARMQQDLSDPSHRGEARLKALAPVSAQSVVARLTAALAQLQPKASAPKASEVQPAPAAPTEAKAPASTSAQPAEVKVPEAAPAPQAPLATKAPESAPQVAEPAAASGAPTMRLLTPEDSGAEEASSEQGGEDNAAARPQGTHSLNTFMMVDDSMSYEESLKQHQAIDNRVKVLTARLEALSRMAQDKAPTPEPPSSGPQPMSAADLSKLIAGQLERMPPQASGAAPAVPAGKVFFAQLNDSGESVAATAEPPLSKATSFTLVEDDDGEPQLTAAPQPAPPSPTPIVSAEPPTAQPPAPAPEMPESAAPKAPWPEVPVVPKHPEPQAPWPEVPVVPVLAAPKAPWLEVPVVPDHPELKAPWPQVPVVPELAEPKTPWPEVPVVPELPEPQAPELEVRGEPESAALKEPWSEVPVVPELAEPKTPWPQVPVVPELAVPQAPEPEVAVVPELAEPKAPWLEVPVVPELAALKEPWPEVPVVPELAEPKTPWPEVPVLPELPPAPAVVAEAVPVVAPVVDAAAVPDVPVAPAAPALTPTAPAAPEGAPAPAVAPSAPAAEDDEEDGLLITPASAYSTPVGAPSTNPLTSSEPNVLWPNSMTSYSFSLGPRTGAAILGGAFGGFESGAGSGH